MTQFASDMGEKAADGLRNQGGNTASPSPNDPWKFDKRAKMEHHFSKHVMERSNEAWEELFGMSREQMMQFVNNPEGLATLQTTYQRIGQQVATEGNYIGHQVGGQRVFFDTSTRVVTILEPGSDKFMTVMRITSRREFQQTMMDYGLELAPGLNSLESILQAAGL